MIPEDRLRGLEQALTNFRRDDTLSKILDDYAELLRDHQKLEIEYEEARESRERYKKLSKGLDRGQYVVVLIDGDGDGYHFHDDFIRKGAEDGGGNAARALHEAVKAKLEAKNLGHCQVVVRIYANVVGLSKTLAKVGLCGPEKRSLTPFIANFNRSFGNYDFVDAGELKESADFKLRDQLRHHISNVQCKHIFFAACHDEAYIAELTPHKGDRERFTLVSFHGVGFHQKFHKLDMNIESFTGVFRTAPLDIAGHTRTPSKPMNSKAQNLPPTSPSAVVTPHPTMDSTRMGPSRGPKRQEPCPFFQVGKCWYGTSCKMAHVASRAVHDEKASINGSGKQQQQHQGNNAQQPGLAHVRLEAAENISKLPRKGDIPDHNVAVNKNGFRLDPYIPPVSAAAINLLHKRAQKSPLCNKWHLTGVCGLGDKCSYDHIPLDEAVKPALELRARALRCKKGGGCRDAFCTKGHICQVLDCRLYGGTSTCWLHDDSHKQDFAPAGFIYGPLHLSESKSSSDFESSNEGDTTNVVPVDGPR
jgi:hypothetical protein